MVNTHVYKHACMHACTCISSPQSTVGELIGRNVKLVALGVKLIGRNVKLVKLTSKENVFI